MNLVNTESGKITFKPDEILQLFKEKNIDYDWSLGKYKPSERGKWTHSYHRYPAKFIPQLVEKLIDEMETLLICILTIHFMDAEPP